MVPKVDLEGGKKNYEDASRIAPDRYERGVKKAEWKSAAASDAAEKAFKDKLEKALAEERRKKAIAKLTDDDWRKPAIELGKNRLREGMAGKADKWATNFEPYAKAIEGVTLPPKTADWRENIHNRLEPIVEAMVKKKEEKYK